jgi:hypothetical protein
VSWRIEHSDALSLLPELPDTWAQMCVTSPPTDAPNTTLAVLDEVRRVLREDGTLWLLVGCGGPSLDALYEQGWTHQLLPPWSTRLVRGWCPPVRLLLLAKQRRYFYDDHALDYRGTPQRLAWPTSPRQARRPQGCGFVLERERRLQLVRRCILAGSSMLACGVCGAPYRRARPGERAGAMRRPTCSHKNPEGRCLVLDPFCDPGAATAEAARCSGRSFLGITPTHGIGGER